MERQPTLELLDDDLGTPEEIQQSLDDLWRINRWLGGTSSAKRLLDRVISKAGLAAPRILDVGCGDARLAAWLQREFAQRNVSAKFCALDRRLSHLDGGRPRVDGLWRAVADALSPPFRDRSFDIVMSNLFFHHLSGNRARDFLRGLAALAERAVVMIDLERHWLPHFFIRVAWPFTLSRITRHDGPASVRQAYTRDELSAIVAEAGFSGAEIQKLPFYRLGLILWK